MAATFQQRGWSDREVKVRRQELLKILSDNRKRHIADYKLACKGYRQAALAKIEEVSRELKRKVEELQEGRPISLVSLTFHLPAPVSHEKSYDQIIRMMEMEVSDEVVLTADQFGCFVMDDWQWKQDWGTSNAAYFGGMAASWQPDK